MTQEIDTRIDSGILTIAFNRLQRKNAITNAMYTTLADALAAGAIDPGVRVAVIQGHESVFTAGNDIADFAKGPPAEDPPVLRFLQTIATFPKPLLAAVCGPAVGIGTTLLLHVDMAYAGENAAFVLPFVDLGLCPEAASSLLLPQMLGYHRAAEALFTGEPMGAQEALALGLVNKVLAPAEVNAFAQAQARKLAAKPISSLLEIKRLMKKGNEAAIVQQIADEGATFQRMLGEPAAREAMAAFMEKRKPDFSGL